MEKNRDCVKKKGFYKFGIGLLITSVFFWLIPVITPFTPLSTQIKTVVIAGSLIIAEITFWLGAIFAGKEAVAKLKSYLNPRNWRRKKERVDPAQIDFEELATQVDEGPTNGKPANIDTENSKDSKTKIEIYVE